MFSFSTSSVLRAFIETLPLKRYATIVLTAILAALVLSMSACTPADLNAQGGTTDAVQQVIKNDQVSYCVNDQVLKCSDVRDDSWGRPSMYCEMTDGSDPIYEGMSLLELSQKEVGYFVNNLGETKIRVAVRVGSINPQQSGFPELKETDKKIWITALDTNLVKLFGGSCQDNGLNK